MIRIFGPGMWRKPTLTSCRLIEPGDLPRLLPAEKMDICYKYDNGKIIQGA